MELKLKKGIKSYASLPVEIKGINKENYTLDAIFSTQDVDRHGDTVMQDGWDLKHFKKNPVILNSHNYGDAAEVIGRADNVRIEKKKLEGVITFAVNENPKAKVIFDLYAGGFLSAFSVGFIPKKFKENKDGTVDWWNIEEAELLEVSAVSVPANARALAKAKGIDTDALDEPDTPEETTPEETNIEPETEEIEPETTVTAQEDTVTEPIKEEEAVVIPEETKEEEKPEETISPAPAKSYKAKVAEAIRNMEQERKEALQRVAKTIQKMLNNDDIKGLDQKVGEQVRKRKINQTIRSLMKINK